MSVMRRVRAEGRKAVVAACALALAGLATGGYFISEALAAPKPPTPTLSASVTSPTTSTSVQFTFTDSAGLTFKCSRDGALFTNCVSGIPYAGLAQGNHTFSVEAFQGTNASNPATFQWAIVPLPPTITGHPANPTNATSATFTFNEPSQPSVAFKCALDGSGFGSCTSPKTYNNLGNGNHTFQVEAQVGSNPPSVPATFGWTIDLTAPTITLSFPTNGGAYNAAGWTNGCTPSAAGICGSAADPSGVASVGVALRQQSSGKYWNGSTFSSNSIVFNPTTGTPTAWKFAKAVPADGQYTVSVKATDSLGNTTTNNDLRTATFAIDTVAPAAPVLTQKPSNPSKDKNPEISFTNTEASVTFTCKLDSGTPTPCTGDTDHDGDGTNKGEGDSNGPGHTEGGGAFGEIQYTNLSPGPHCFSVYATDTAANTSTTTTFCWTISGTVTGNTITVVSGTPQTATAGGTFAAPLVAKVTNSSNVGVSGVAVTFTAPTSGVSGTFAASGCTSNSPTSTCTVTTNASGIATSSAFTANGTSGGYTVTATATGVVTPANFALTNAAVVTFQVTGNPPAPFSPGLTQRMNLSVTNPNASPLTVPVGGITIGINTGTSACPPFSTTPPNFTVTSVGQSFVIPANTTSPVTLSSLSVTTANLPAITMNNTPFNQDGCKTAHLILSYTGNGSGS